MHTAAFQLLINNNSRWGGSDSWGYETNIQGKNKRELAHPSNFSPQGVNMLGHATFTTTPAHKVH